MKVVLGGSRHLEYIPSEVAERLNHWIEENSEFMVGDAPGSDRTIQLFLKSRNYRLVSVYTSADEIRNNLAGWPVVKVDSGLKSKSNAMHAFKDRRMSEISDIGLMIWDCRSIGTLCNVIDIVSQGKKCAVWVAPDSVLYEFDNLNSLEKWMVNYSQVREEALNRLFTFRKREAKRTLLNSQPELFE